MTDSVYLETQNEEYLARCRDSICTDAAIFIRNQKMDRVTAVDKALSLHNMLKEADRDDTGVKSTLAEAQLPAMPTNDKARSQIEAIKQDLLKSHLTEDLDIE